MSSQNLKINNEGFAQITLNVSSNLKDALLFSYEYKGKMYKQFISVPMPDNKYSVSFHPEGGDIPAGIYTKVAFKAINSSGLGEYLRRYCQSKWRHN